MKSGALKPEMKLGADKKRVAALGALVVVLVVVWWINRSDTPAAVETGPASTVARPPAPGIRTPVTRPRTPAGQPGSPVRSAQFGGRSQATQEFRPTLTPDTPIDPAKVDPTLKLELIARLKTVKVEGGSRSLFDFGQSAAPKIEIAKVKPVLPRMAKAIMTGPVQPPPPPVPAPLPPPPAIPLKFYGFSSYRQGAKRAFFIEGEDIFVAGEGDTIKNRYKIIRIGVNSAVVEDINYKNQQTLPLTEEAAQQS